MEKIKNKKTGVRNGTLKNCIKFYEIISNRTYTEKPNSSILKKIVLSENEYNIDFLKITFFIENNLRLDKEKNIYYFIKLENNRLINFCKAACEFSHNKKIENKINLENYKKANKIVKNKKPIKVISILWGLIKYQINQ